MQGSSVYLQEVVAGILVGGVPALGVVQAGLLGPVTRLALAGHDGRVRYSSISHAQLTTTAARKKSKYAGTSSIRQRDTKHTPTP